MQTNKWYRFFHNIPGAWYGNPDPTEYGWGNVVINPIRTVPAIKFMSRRVIITETKVVQTAGNVAGLLITYKPR